MKMNNLNKFCIIISNLRKDKGWTQTTLAEKLGISSQSVSKWECGIGYPDVTLFPVIAELFGVSVAVLFGETLVSENNIGKYSDHERSFVFEQLKNIEIRVGNVCRIEVIDGENESSRLDLEGDASFVEFFSIEKIYGGIKIEVKNPSGAGERWTPYDREGYSGEHLIRIYTGSVWSNVDIYNYLDISVEESEKENGIFEWICNI
jgi:transcriptional regulator with XRE-family HTH domain